MKTKIAYLSFALLLFASTLSFAFQAKDSRGKLVRLSSPPKRIVSLSPNCTEILYALRLDKQIAAVTRFCNYPPAAKHKPKVGDVSMSVESIAKFKPDLVLAHAALHDDLIPKLEQLGIKVFATDPKTIEQTISAITSIGQLTGTVAQARSITASMRSRMKSILASFRPKKAHRVLVCIQSNPLWVAGPATIPNEILTKLKAKNIAYDARRGYVTFSTELAVARNPDLIIVGTKSDATYFTNSTVWKATSAVRNKRVVVINPDLLVRPGPRIIDGLKAVADNLGF